MLRWSTKEFRRDQIICLFFKCSPPKWLSRSYSTLTVISLPLIFSSYYKTHCAQFDFFPLQGSAITVKTVSPQLLPAPSSSVSHLKRRKWADGLLLKPHRLAWTMPCPSWVTRESSLTISVYRWSLYSGRNYTNLVASCEETAVYGKLLACGTCSAIAAIIIVMKPTLIHPLSFLHSWNNSGFDRGFDSTES